MKEEPRYIAPGDEFEEEDNSWKYKDDLSEQGILLIDKVFRICRRKYFHSPKEKRAWSIIIGQVERGLIPMVWIDNCLEWAETSNQTVLRIKPMAIANLIRNKARMTDYLGSNPDLLRKPEDYSTPDDNPYT